MKRTQIIVVVQLSIVIIVLAIICFQSKQKITIQNSKITELETKLSQIEKEKKLSPQVNIMKEMVLRQEIDSLKKELDKLVVKNNRK